MDPRQFLAYKAALASESQVIGLMADKIKNIFISHVREDDSGLSDLKDLAATHGLDIHDRSITFEKSNAAKDSDYIKQ